MVQRIRWSESEETHVILRMVHLINTEGIPETYALRRAQQILPASRQRSATLFISQMTPAFRAKLNKELQKYAEKAGTTPVKAQPYQEVEPAAISAETILSQAIASYVSEILKPSIDKIVEEIHSQVTKAMATAIKDAPLLIAEKVEQRLQQQVQVHDLLQPEAAEDQQSTTHQEINGAQPPAALKQTVPDIVVMGLLPRNTQLLMMALRDAGVEGRMRIRFVEELNELNRLVSKETYLLHLTKFSPHLPSNIKDKVKRVIQFPGSVPQTKTKILEVLSDYYQ